MSDFSVHAREAGSVHVLDIEGELDAHTASQLETAFEECQQNGRHQIVVNGANLDYISSAGLGVFMAFIEEVREEGGDIKIAALQPSVYNVFDLLGFPTLFDIVDTEEEALARFDEEDAPVDAASGNAANVDAANVDAASGDAEPAPSSAEASPGQSAN